MITAKIGDIIKKKGSKVITIDAAEPIQNAVELMVRHNIGAVIVTEKDSICGIFTERDYLKKVAHNQLDSKEKRVGDISSCNLIAVDLSYSAIEAMAIMTEQKCRHLPVMEGGELVGLVSIGDLVRQASSDQETHIHYLTDYVTGKYPG